MGESTQNKPANSEYLGICTGGVNAYYRKEQIRSLSLDERDYEGKKYYVISITFIDGTLEVCSFEPATSFDRMKMVGVFKSIIEKL